MPRGFESHPLRQVSKKVEYGTREDRGKILTGVGLALGIAGSAMAIHHRISYRKWADDEGPCHGRAGLALTGMVIPLLIAAHELNKREKQ